jgi:putative transposase
VAHHITQRGNRRQPTFFRAFDYELYRQLLREHCEKAQVSIWAYSLLPNHVHLIAVPRAADGLRNALSVAHRRYTLRINRREGWRGCLWQGRFASFPMDERHLLAATRYVLLNPVRAGLADRPEDWPYSSARAHLGQAEDDLVDFEALAERIADWKAFLTTTLTLSEKSRFRCHESSGLPLGDERFLEEVQTLTGRDVEVELQQRRRAQGQSSSSKS